MILGSGKKSRSMKGTVKQYIHLDKKRSYNPPVGLVTSETDMESPKMRYSYDPHIDPSLLWSGKQEEVSFDVDTVSLHVPLTIIEKFLKKKDFSYGFTIKIYSLTV